GVPSLTTALTTAVQQAEAGLDGYDGAGVAKAAYPLKASDGGPVDPWGSPTQSTDLSSWWTTWHPTTPECPPGTPDDGRTQQAPADAGDMSTPDDVTPDAAHVPARYQLAHRLG